MKTILLAFCALAITMSAMAQNDTTVTKADTIKIGGIIVVKKPGKDDDKKEIEISNRRKRKPSNLSTNWWIVDLGFANLHDETNYASPQAQAMLGTGIGKDQFELRTGKSVNVNIWAFMQKLNVIKHVVNLKYGLGVELNNYHFDDERIRMEKNPTLIVIDPSYEGLKKNKLAVDYLTVPFMVNLNFTPGREKGFGLSGGVSAGYMYSARQKIKNNNDKDKLHDDFDLRRWKISYIGEVNLGPVRLYGSYALKSMWEKGLDQTPYNVGIRFSNW